MRRQNIRHTTLYFFSYSSLILHLCSFVLAASIIMVTFVSLPEVTGILTLEIESQVSSNLRSITIYSYFWPNVKMTAVSCVKFLLKVHFNIVHVHIDGQPPKWTVHIKFSCTLNVVEPFPEKPSNIFAFSCTHHWHYKGFLSLSVDQSSQRASR